MAAVLSLDMVINAARDRLSGGAGTAGSARVVDTLNGDGFVALAVTGPSVAAGTMVALAAAGATEAHQVFGGSAVAADGSSPALSAPVVLTEGSWAPEVTVAVVLVTEDSTAVVADDGTRFEANSDTGLVLVAAAPGTALRLERDGEVGDVFARLADAVP